MLPSCSSLSNLEDTNPSVLPCHTCGSSRNPAGFARRLVPALQVVPWDGRVGSCWEGDTFQVCVTGARSLLRQTTRWRLSV